MFKFKTAGKSAVTGAGENDHKDNNPNEHAETDARLGELENAIDAINYARKLLSQAIADDADSPAQSEGMEQRDAAGGSRIFTDGRVSSLRGKQQQT